MTSVAFTWLAIGSLGFTCFVAVGARALRSFSRYELEAIHRRRDSLPRFADILHRHEQVALGVEVLLLLAVSLFVVCGVGSVAGSPLSEGWTGLLATTVCCALALSIAVVWIPWAVSRLWAERFLYHTWNFWSGISLVVRPLLVGAFLVDALFHRLAGRLPENPSEETIEEEIRTIVNEGHREGLLEEDAREMIEGVIELGDADVSQIMTPRTDMQMIHGGMSWEGMLDEVIRSGHTRIPVFEKNRDDIIGILYSKDLLPELAKSATEPRRSIKELLRKPYFVPETKKVDDLLEVFQQTRNHLAIVLDEYGGVSGLVTIEDVLEEIVGEIVDEYDKELEEEIQKIDERTCEALGRAHVDEINDRMNVQLPEDGDFDTIGGFVFSELGYVPSAGESITWNDLVRLTVLEASRRRINRVRVEILSEPTRESA